MPALAVVSGRDEAETARLAAHAVLRAITDATARGRRAALAFSGGTTPWLMIGQLVRLAPPWERLDIFQVDERWVDPADPRSNARHLSALLPAGARVHRIPVDTAGDPEEIARVYERRLTDLLGAPPVFDLVHLGLGADGHTASLVPGDPVLDVEDRWVAATVRPYQGVRRVTLTFPVLEKSRRLLWLVTGDAKRPILRRFLAGDPALPASRLPRETAALYADEAALGSPSSASPARGSSASDG